MTRVECFVASLSRVSPDKSSSCDGNSVVEEAIEDAVFVELNLCLVKGPPALKPMQQAASGLIVTDMDALRRTLPDAAS
jgi:hypothetical protein